MAWFKKSKTQDERALQETEEQTEDGELAIDVFQDGDNVVVKSTIAGVKPEDLDISVSQNEVSISGERKSEQEISQDDYFYQECYWGSFARTFSLPSGEREIKNPDCEIGISVPARCGSSRRSAQTTARGGQSLP